MDKGAFWAGLLSAGMGALIVLVALGLIRVDAGSVHAPMWVLGAAGMLFVLAGVAILTPDAVKALRGTRAAAGPVAALQGVLGSAIIALFALIANWVAFAPGERAFEGSFSLGFLQFGGMSDQIVGRVLFGVGAVLLDLVLVVLVYRGVTSLLRAFRPTEDDPGP